MLQSSDSVMTMIAEIKRVYAMDQSWGSGLSRPDKVTADESEEIERLGSGER